ncbi:hypothetical protein E6C27_scaffold138G00390 [Cucumis melo var. makuwa]|uniref:Ty3-gypsy retrotransposon protein n=1 Tax=Cucumis melo var. makuwa TaxID=1194695 RepID=A0A5A7VQA9_CUCMM|nr:hypothetical protein E6C27_scaffold138G00390 [Cucumis melo var. makuwa]
MYPTQPRTTKPSRNSRAKPSRLPSEVNFPSQSLDPPSHLSRVHSCRVSVSLGVGKVTFEFRNFTASIVEVNSPLLGWICLDADLNEILATSQTPMPGCSVYCSYVGGLRCKLD